MHNISEKDLFTFVFYSDDLSEEKRNVIISNLDKFNSELEFLRGIKSVSEKPIPQSIIERIHEKIENFETKAYYILRKVETISDSEYLILAADSPEQSQSSKTATYVDSTNKFLCKIITSKEANKIYLFSNIDRDEQEFEITLFPSNDLFIVNIKEMPIVLSPKQIISKIKLKLVN